MAKSSLGKAYVQIVPSADGITGSITKILKPEADSAGTSSGKSFGKKFIAAVGAAGIGAAFTKLISDSVKQGAALEQSIGGVETLFKDAADELIANANRAYKTAGVSANSYMEQATSFAAALVSSLGGDTQRAAQIADMAIIDMADNANRMGTSIDAIQTSYQSFARGQYQLLDNLKLGYGGTRAEMERLLADAEKLTGIEYDISNLSDVYEAIHVIQTELGITGTTAEEATETVSGSFAQMKAAYDNFLGKMALGEDVKPQLEALAETVGIFLGDNLIPMVYTAITGLGKGLWEYLTGSALPKLGEWFDGVIDNINDWGRKTREKIFQPFTDAYNDVTGWFANIKKLFAEKLRLSGLELPHISFGYKTTGTMAEIAQKFGFKGVPQISVEWYAKGGIFSNPSIIGVGEAGDEAVVPLNRFWSQLDEMTRQIVGKIDKIEKRDNNPIICYVTLDGRTIAKASAPYIDKELGTTQQMKERGAW